MADSSQGKLARRTVLLSGGSAVGLSLAGCIGGSDEEGEGDGEDSGGGNGSDDDGGDSEAGSYTVSMEPVGEVEFESPPETWSVYEADYADMGVALAQGDGLLAVGEPERYHTQHYEELPGVEVDRDSLTPLFSEGIDRELFYELDSDVHLIDPQWLINNEAFGLDESDVEEIDEAVAPFFGNTIFRRTDEWHDYEYYTLYEAFERVAQVFQEEERYEEFAALHEEFIEGIQERLPEERPDALLVWGEGDEPETFSPYRLDDEGTSNKQFHDLGIGDALAETGIGGLSTTDRGEIDYETMLDVDPDALLVRGHEEKSAEEFENTVLAFMEDHPVASDLSAVEEGRVFRGGPLYQGPIINLFSTERAAQELFPEEFGDEELFDRERVAGVVDGR